MSTASKHLPPRTTALFIAEAKSYAQFKLINYKIIVLDYFKLRLSATVAAAVGKATTTVSLI